MTTTLPTLEWQLSKSAFTNTSSAWARLRVIAPTPAVQNSVPRKGLACAFSVDCSGSMSDPAGADDQGLFFSRPRDPSESKMERAKQALLEAIDALTDQDMASLTAFSSSATTLFPLTKMTDQAKDLMRQRVKALKPSGGTALHAGWTEAGKEAAKGLHHQLFSRVILLTDGEATDGERNPEVLAQQAKGLAALGVSTSCFGLGASFNEDLLCAMAEGGDGNFRYIPDAILATAAVMDEISGLDSQMGRRVRLSLSALQGIVSVKDLNALQQEADGSLILTSLITGRPVDILVELALEAAFTGSEAHLSADLSWEDRHQIRQSLQSVCVIDLVQDESLMPTEEDQEIAGLRSSLLAAQEKKTMVEAMTRGDMVAAGASLSRAKAALSAAPSGYSGLIHESSQMDALESTYLSGDMGSTRKTAMWQNYTSTKNRSLDTANNDTKKQ